MIDHEHYRRALLTDPSLSDPELIAHRNACAQCRAFTDRVLGFEDKLARAIKVPLTRDADVLPFTRRNIPAAYHRRWVALAASALITLGVVSGFWLAVPRTTLAAEVVAHMAGEPNAWNTHVPVPGPELASVLKNANMSLNSDAPAVNYASSCNFRGHVVPHLVVQTSRGPVTVMVLVREHGPKTTDFDENGYRGTIVPVPQHGSLAILMRIPDASRATVDAIASQVRSAIVWGSPSGTAGGNSNR